MPVSTPAEHLIAAGLERQLKGGLNWVESQNSVEADYWHCQKTVALWILQGKMKLAERRPLVHRLSLVEDLSPRPVALEPVQLEPIQLEAVQLEPVGNL